jgi:hypothetical protein
VEINTILEIMEHSPRENVRTEVLYRRLLQQKKWHIRNQHLIDKEYTEQVELLNTAISEKRMVILHNYSSVKSNTISDRIVEPYVFMGNNDSVRCYEHSTQTDKTFRLSRIGSVELMPINWIHEDRHGQVFTDAFNFSGERQFPVEICLNFRAVRLLVEEYPGCTPYVMRKSGTEWRLKMNVCDFRGIGRFCLGLFKDVKPIGSQAFLDYLKENENRCPTFSEFVVNAIKERGMENKEFYIAAKMDRKLFSAIKNDVDYKPKKETAVACCFALKLSLDDAKLLLECAGYSLSMAIQWDRVVYYCLREGITDIADVNEFLYDLDEKLIRQ